MQSTACILTEISEQAARTLGVAISSRADMIRNLYKGQVDEQLRMFAELYHLCYELGISEKTAKGLIL